LETLMKRVVAFLILTLLWVAGCGSGDKATENQGTSRWINIVCTTGQVADLVSNIGGDRVQVTALMGPGIDPHLYKASARDVERLRSADLLFYNGLHLEAKMGEVIEQIGRNKPVLAVAEAVDEGKLLAPDDYEGAHDPHIWFDVALWAETVPAVVKILADHDPEHAADYTQRGEAYMSALTKLDAHARRQFASIPEGQRVMITAHDAFNYLGRAYGLEVRGLQGISTATEAGTRDVQELAVYIAENKIPALFIESSVSPRAVNAVKEAVKSRGFQVVIGGEIFSDALGDAGTPAGTYIGMVRHNVDIISKALRGESTGNHE
jgi:manganese/zinc/iron transport system substrate-binding protein